MVPFARQSKAPLSSLSLSLRPLYLCAPSRRPLLLRSVPFSITFCPVTGTRHARTSVPRTRGRTRGRETTEREERTRGRRGLDRNSHDFENGGGTTLDKATYTAEVINIPFKVAVDPDARLGVGGFLIAPARSLHRASVSANAFSFLNRLKAKRDPPSRLPSTSIRDPRQIAFLHIGFHKRRKRRNYLGARAASVNTVAAGE